MSISFDRAASYYDRTRAFDDATAAQLIPMLASELAASERVIEIGIGTGRVALPLTKQGVAITGVDISREMLARLRVNAGGHPPPVAIADATRLPFAEGTFDAAIAAHVLHLIPQWRDAIDELVRVVRPGGLIVASRGGRTLRSDWWIAVRQRFFVEAGDRPWPPGMDRIEELDDEMRRRGADVKELPRIDRSSYATVSDLLRLLEDGVWSACWTMDEASRRSAAAAAREWALTNVGDLDEPRPLTEVLAWRAYRLA